jgi:hypothetical protein
MPYLPECQSILFLCHSWFDGAVCLKLVAVEVSNFGVLRGFFMETFLYIICAYLFAILECTAFLQIISTSERPRGVLFAGKKSNLMSSVELSGGKLQQRIV